MHLLRDGGQLHVTQARCPAQTLAQICHTIVREEKNMIHYGDFGSADWLLDWIYWSSDALSLVDWLIDWLIDWPFSEFGKYQSNYLVFGRSIHWLIDWVFFIAWIVSDCWMTIGSANWNARRFLRRLQIYIACKRPLSLDFALSVGLDMKNEVLSLGFIQKVVKLHFFSQRSFQQCHLVHCGKCIWRSNSFDRSVCL